MNTLNEYTFLDNVCSTCLSCVRKLYPLKDLEEYSISWEYIVQLNIKTEYICWECRAIIMKIWNFKQQAREAQRQLKIQLKNGAHVKCLSRLTQINTINITVNSLKSGGEDLEREVQVKEEIFNQDTELEIKEEPIKRTENVDNTESHSNRDNDIKIESNEMTNYKETVKEPREVDVQYGEINITDRNTFEDENKRANLKRNVNDNKVDRGFTVKQLTREEVIVARDEKRRLLQENEHEFQCENCILSFDSEISLHKHNLSKHKRGNKECEICKCNFSKQFHLNEHLKKHFIVYACSICNFIHKSKVYMKKHCTNKHTNINNALSIFKCKVCNNEFLTKTAMKYHRKTAHTEVTCEVCGKTLKEKSTLKMHMLLHTGMPMFKCDICKKSYRGKWGLRAHKRTHRDLKPEGAYCAECDVQYSSVYQYRQHLREHSKHITVKHECFECGKKLGTKQSLKYHINIVHLKNGNHKCDQCDKMFISRSRLNKHVNDIHKRVAKPKRFQCTICTKMFSAKTVLQNHVNVHTGARPHKCDRCEACFGQSGALYKHRRLVHKVTRRCDRADP